MGAVDGRPGEVQGVRAAEPGEEGLVQSRPHLGLGPLGHPAPAGYAGAEAEFLRQVFRGSRCAGRTGCPETRAGPGAACARGAGSGAQLLATAARSPPTTRHRLPRATAEPPRTSGSSVPKRPNHLGDHFLRSTKPGLQVRPYKRLPFPGPWALTVVVGPPVVRKRCVGDPEGFFGCGVRRWARKAEAAHVLLRVESSGLGSGR